LFVSAISLVLCASKNRVPSFSAVQLGIIACYLAAGIAIGYVCEGQKFTWIYIVTYVPTHLVAGWTFGIYPYSLLAHLANYYACQGRRRQKLVLETER
jgi:hypothetical protein